MKAGELRQRFSFAFRQEVDDGIGNKQGDWIQQFERDGKRIILKAGESVMASRLSGRQPAIITIRYSREAAQITTDWRCTDTRSREIFNIRQVMIGEKRDYIELLIEGGVAV